MASWDLYDGSVVISSLTWYSISWSSHQGTTSKISILCLSSPRVLQLIQLLGFPLWDNFMDGMDVSLPPWIHSNVNTASTNPLKSILTLCSRGYNIGLVPGGIAEMFLSSLDRGLYPFPPCLLPTHVSRSFIFWEEDRLYQLSSGSWYANPTCLPPWKYTNIQKSFRWG